MPPDREGGAPRWVQADTPDRLRLWAEMDAEAAAQRRRDYAAKRAAARDAEAEQLVADARELVAYSRKRDGRAFFMCTDAQGTRHFLAATSPDLCARWDSQMQRQQDGRALGRAVDALVRWVWDSWPNYDRVGTWSLGRELAEAFYAAMNAGRSSGR